MGIKINYDDSLSIYDIETKINGCVIEKENIEFSDVQNNVVKLNISLKYDIQESKESFLKKILFYLFGILYIYFNTLEAFLDSNEYRVQLIIDDFKENSDLNILLKKEGLKLVTEVLNNNCNIVENSTETKINQDTYTKKLKKYKKMCFISTITIMLIPTYFLITSLIFKKYDMALVSFVLELILGFMCFLLLKKIIKNRYIISI